MGNSGANGPHIGQGHGDVGLTPEEMDGLPQIESHPQQASHTLVAGEATVAGIVVTGILSAPVGGEGKAAEGAIHSFSVEEQEGSLIITNAVGPHGAIRFMAEHVREGETLVLKGFDIEGPGAAKMGRNGLNAFAQAYGKSQGVKRLIIEGAKRSTGRNIGRMPTPKEFEIK